MWLRETETENFMRKIFMGLSSLQSIVILQLEVGRFHPFTGHKGL